MATDDRREQFVTGMTRIHLQEHSLLIHMMEGTDEVPGLRHIPGVQVFLDSADTVDRDLISAIGINGIDFTQLTAEDRRCAQVRKRYGISRPDRRDPRLPAALPQRAGYRRLPARYRRNRSYREGIRKKDTNRRRA